MTSSARATREGSLSPAKRCRVALIGPVLPYRGGVSQYTTQLHRALAAQCELHTVSYVRQYPAWLYPGKSDREPGREGYREPGTEYLLDAVNPFTWHATVQHISAIGCELAVFDWWTLFWAPAIALMALALRRRGIRVAFICHNLFDHDAGRAKRALARCLLKPANAYLVHSNEQAATLRHAFPHKRVVVHAHPTYDQFPPPSTAMAKRGRLEILFFGFVRPYKGLDVLVQALAHLDDSSVYLTVVGEPWIRAEQLRARIAELHAPNVELHLDYVDDRSAANFFGRADLVALPYRSASGSGVLAMAFHYGCPVLATRTGAFPDIIEPGVNGFLVDPDSVDQLTGCIRKLTREYLSSLRTNVRAVKDTLSWQSLASAVAGLCRATDVRSDQKPHLT